MKKEHKRFTISVSPELFERLRTLQKEKWPQNSQNEMLVNLIRKGLEAAERDMPMIQSREEKE